ncbi:hypothetical protein KM043_000946 [Ampulex compressa]|nr:hypothetical protein KM043_000946 [Ampulex compressa]
MPSEEAGKIAGGNFALDGGSHVPPRRNGSLCSPLSPSAFSPSTPILAQGSYPCPEVDPASGCLLGLASHAPSDASWIGTERSVRSKRPSSPLFGAAKVKSTTEAFGYSGPSSWLTTLSSIPPRRFSKFL